MRRVWGFLFIMPTWMGCTAGISETDEPVPIDTMEDSAAPILVDTASDDPWYALRQSIEAAEVSDLAVMIGPVDGVQFIQSKGDVEESDTLLLASASKWLASMTLLAAIEDGVLALDDHPQDHLSWWTSDPADLRSTVTLEQLLSFTSGFSGGINDVPCVEDETMELDECAQTIYADFFEYEPGTTFFYGPSHLQIAGAMVTAATGDSFHRVFREQIGSPLGLNIATGFALPSLNNPRVAGGGTASATDYSTILTALVRGELLSAKSIKLLGQDHTGDGVDMVGVPDTANEGERDWHYALGCWRECAEDPYPASCDEPGVLSSPGAFGFYPWWDTAHGVWGVIAIQLFDAEGGGAITIPLGQEWSQMALAAL